jgi:fructose-1,6-bisphosphatase/inositol monophosphatase family enzyme
MLEVVEILCEQIRANARGPVTVTQKPDRSLVTNVDLVANQTVAEWAKQFTDCDFIGEEGFNALTGASHCLYLDPLDGTSTFIAGKAEVAVALTLMERVSGGAWRPVACIIAEPLTWTVWAATRGGGVHMKGPKDATMRRIEVALKDTPPYNVTAITWTGVPYHLDAVLLDLIRHDDIIEHGGGNTAITGALIAGGWMQGMLFAGGSAVESTAISLMVSEAGGVVTDLTGGPIELFRLGTDARSGKPDFILERGIIAASCPALADLLLGLVRTHN